MKVIINVVHPSQVLKTKYIYKSLIQKGHEVIYAARDREVIITLLKSFNARFEIISKKSNFIREVFIMFFNLLKLRLKFKPDVILAIEGSLAPFVSWLTGVRCLHWSDSEHSKVMNFLSHPWSTKTLTSKSYRLGYAFSGFLKNKRILHNSNFQLNYCGPNYFSPINDFKKQLGIDNSKKLFFMRLGNFDSYHDLNTSRPNLNQLEDLASYLSGIGHLEISFEGIPPETLKKYKMRLEPWLMQQYLYHSELTFSQGACTASESAMLGTPCVFQSHLKWGYIEDEINANILFRAEVGEILSKCIKYINTKTDPQFKSDIKNFLKNKDDLVKLNIEILENDKFWKIKKTIDPKLNPFNIDIRF